ncbi:MAG: hypothetical protein RR144_05455 [Clostridia bacterium]
MADYLYLIIFWRNIVIGKVYKNDSGKYKYFPNFDNIIIASEQLNMPIMFSINPQITWGNLPQFISERIMIDPQFKTECKLMTDKFRIKKVN